MRHFSAVLAVLLLLCLTPAAPALVEVALTGGSAETVQAGSVVNRGLLIHNTSDEPVSIAVDLDIPGGMRILIPPKGVDLDGKESTLVLFSLAVSGVMPAGEYTVGYRVNTDPSAAGKSMDTTSSPRGSLSVVIAAAPSVDVRIDGGPSFVTAGGSYETRGHIINTGNTPLALRASASGSDRSSITILELESEGFDIQPGETRQALLHVTTRDDITRPVRERIELSVSGPGVPERHDSVTVEIIPSVTLAEDLYRRGDLLFSTGIASDFDAAAGYMPSLAFHNALAGYLDPEGKHRIDLALAAAMDTENGFPSTTASFMDSVETFFAGYSNSLFRLSFGDRARTVSSLTQENTVTRGVDLDVYLGKFSLGGLYQVAPGEVSTWGSTGGYVKYTSAERSLAGKPLYIAGASYFKPAGEPGILSLTQNLRSPGDSYLMLETAMDDELFTTTDLRLIDETALLGNLAATSSRISVSMNGHFAGADFSGTRRDRAGFAGRVQVSPFASAFRLTGQASGDVVNINGNLEDENYRTGFEARGGIGFTLQDIDVDGAYHYRTYEEEQSAGPLLIRYHGGSLSTRFGNEKVSFDMESHLGLNLNLHDQTRSFSQEHTTSFLVNPSEYLNLRFSSVYRQLVYNVDDPMNQFRLGASARYRSEHFFLSAGTELTGRPETDNNLDIAGRLSLSFTPDPDHAFNLSLAHTASRLDAATPVEHDFSLEFSFSVKTGIKMGMKDAFGSLSGSVIRGSDGAPLSGVVLRVGNYAGITDENGTFTFPALPEGEHLLTVDRRSLETGYRTESDMPMKIVIKAQQRDRVAITVVEAAELSGRIKNIAYNSSQSLVQEMLGNTRGDSLKETYPQGTRVALARGDQSMWTVTDSQGYFSFSDLTPGDWNLRIIGMAEGEKVRVEAGSSLPEGEPSEQLAAIPVPEGESVYLELSRLPARREVRILETTGTISVIR